MALDDLDGTISIADAAKRLGKSRARAYQMVRDGALPTVTRKGKQRVEAAVIEQLCAQQARSKSRRGGRVEQSATKTMKFDPEIGDVVPTWRPAFVRAMFEVLTTAVDLTYDEIAEVMDGQLPGHRSVDDLYFLPPQFARRYDPAFLTRLLCRLARFRLLLVARQVPQLNCVADELLMFAVLDNADAVVDMGMTNVALENSETNKEFCPEIVADNHKDARDYVEECRSLFYEDWDFMMLFPRDGASFGHVPIGSTLDFPSWFGTGKKGDLRKADLRSDRVRIEYVGDDPRDAFARSAETSERADITNLPPLPQPPSTALYATKGLSPNEFNDFCIGEHIRAALRMGALDDMKPLIRIVKKRLSSGTFYENAMVEKIIHGVKLTDAEVFAFIHVHVGLATSAIETAGMVLGQAPSADAQLHPETLNGVHIFDATISVDTIRTNGDVILNITGALPMQAVTVCNSNDTCDGKHPPVSRTDRVHDSPSFVFDIGAVSATRTFAYLKTGFGVARWPAGSPYLHLMMPTEAFLQRYDIGAALARM